MEFVFYLLLIALAFVGVVATWRFLMFRNTGTQGVFRELPATGIHGWRHGVLRYHGDELRFYKLRSLSFFNDVSLNRTYTSFVGMRDLTAEEQNMIPNCKQAVVVSNDGEEMEFAVELRAQMALISWIEAAPNRRQEKFDKRALQRRIMQNDD